MDEMKIFSCKKNSKKKMNEKQYKTITIKKIFSGEFKPKLINNNNIKILSHFKENKLSQTLIKKYNYEVNNLMKSNKLSECLNLIASHKYIPAKPIIYSKIKDLIQKIIKDNKTNHTIIKRAESSKVYNKFKENLSSLNINDIYKKIKINKKIFRKKINLNKKNNRNLENIDNNFFNSLNKNITNKSTTQFENKNMKYKLKNNNSTSDIKIIKKSQSMSLIFPKISNETRQLNKNLILSSKIFNKKHPNHIIIRNDLLHSDKKSENINIWKNRIISNLLTNILSTSNVDIYLNKEKIGKNLNQKFRISTLMNIYNKSFFNSHNNEL